CYRETVDYVVPSVLRFTCTRYRLDRHRGGGRPPTPATPPCVRVRTRRFETFGLTLLEQRRKTAVAEIGIRKRNMQGFRMGRRHRAMGSTGSFSCQLGPYT